MMIHEPNLVFLSGEEMDDILSAIAVPAPSPLGLRPEPVPVSAIRRVSTIALALQALLGTLFLYVLIFAHGALA
jgi:hypothetical protein